MIKKKTFISIKSIPAFITYTYQENVLHIENINLWNIPKPRKLNKFGNNINIYRNTIYTLRYPPDIISQFTSSVAILYRNQ